GDEHGNEPLHSLLRPAPRAGRTVAALGARPGAAGGALRTAGVGTAAFPRQAHDPRTPQLLPARLGCAHRGAGIAAVRTVRRAVLGPGHAAHVAAGGGGTPAGAGHAGASRAAPPRSRHDMAA